MAVDYLTVNTVVVLIATALPDEVSVLKQINTAPGTFNAGTDFKMCVQFSSTTTNREEQKFVFLPGWTAVSCTSSGLCQTGTGHLFFPKDITPICVDNSIQAFLFLFLFSKILLIREREREQGEEGERRHPTY